MTERRTQAQRRARSRALILDAAVKLLATRGYAGTSLAEIGKAAGLSRGMRTYHFGTKEACMLAVVTSIREGVVARLQAVETHGVEALERLIDTYFDGLRSDPDHAKAMYVIFIEGITGAPGLRPAVAQANDLLRCRIVSLVREAVGAGQAASGVNPEAVATLLEGTMRGIAQQWLADPDNTRLDEAAELAKSSLRHLIAEPARST